MRSLVTLLIALLILPGLAAPAGAADVNDPDWPCIQRKVLQLSTGQMWAGPPMIGDAMLQAWRDDDAVAALAPVLAVRRTAADDIESLVADFAHGVVAGDRNRRLALLFAGAFVLINRERTEIISGIARYAHKQATLSNRIETRRLELTALETQKNPDLDQVEEMQDGLDWDTRIFRDRAQSLTYVCESPVILERRAFLIARIIMKHLE